MPRCTARARRTASSRIKTKRGVDASPGLKIEARQETGFSDIQGTFHFPTTQMLIMNEDNTRFCIKQTGLPMCSRTIDWDTEAFRINDFPGPNTLTPYSLERDYGIANAASKPELKGLFMVNAVAEALRPGRLGQDATAIPRLDRHAARARADGTGYFMSFNNTTETGAVKYENGYQRMSARANVDQTDRLEPHGVAPDGVHAQPHVSRQLRAGSASRASMPGRT